MTPDQLNRKEILSYLHAAELDDALSAALDAGIAELCGAVRARTVWKVFPVTHQENGVILGDLPLGGRDIAQHLSGCDAAVLLAATLSAAVDALIRRAERSDLTKAVMLDAAAGAAIEQVCRELEQALHERLGQEYRYFTERFSAGYGDFPLSQQRDLIAMLDAPRKIGLTVTANHMLIPMKSVTALIGLSQHPVRDARRYGCGRDCAQCPYREGCPNARGDSASE